uniref:transcription elongation factor GreA n=1 Tax=Eubacterium cellulosolvens TaxID=29322 RepID=UPI000486B634|nr:transcription elongation factor GreA [[Eubacterium] cellulosolvens]
MAEPKKTIMTYAGLKALESELEDLQVNKRKEIAEKLKEARAQGDLSENAEYDAAKDEQAQIEARIEEIEGILKNADVVVEEEADSNTVNIGCKIKVLDKTYDEELEFQIVGSTEANSLKGKISNESPVGRALLGHEIGDVVTIETPVGDEQYEILVIERNV